MAAIKGKPFTTSFFPGNQRTSPPKYPKIKFVGMVFLCVHVLQELDHVSSCESQTGNIQNINHLYEKNEKNRVIGK